jgi:hypothetical protein
VLTPDPDTAPAVQRIFAEFLAGQGIYAIAEGLTRDGPHRPATTPPGTGIGSASPAQERSPRNLLNPRYTGRQVWTKQRKEEILLHSHDVAAQAPRSTGRRADAHSGNPSSNRAASRPDSARTRTASSAYTQ